MGKGNKVAFYAVAKGHQPGIYSTWAECQAQVNSFPGATYKKFATSSDAEDWIASHSKGKAPASAGPSIPLAPTSTSRPTATRAPAPPSTRPTANLPTSPSRAAPRPRSPTEAGAPEPDGSSPKKRQRVLAGQPVEDESTWLIVYSDGACKGNGNVGSVAGVGVWWGYNDERNLAERCPGVQTNNRAELIAIVRVLETTLEAKRPLLIRTDSQYSINCFQTWLPGWIARGWRNSKGEPVKNRELIEYLSALLDRRALSGQKVRLEYVKGHSGEPGNEGADRLANIGATHPELPERDWPALCRALAAAPAVDPERARFVGAGPEVVVPREAKEEFVESSRKLFSADLDAPIEGAELEAYAAGLVDDDELLLELEDDV